MNTSGRILKGLTASVGLAPVAAGCLVLLLACAESRAQRQDGNGTTTVRGKVDRLTTAPKGETDGAVLDDGTTLHWPPHMADRFTDILKKGDRVRATGRTETGPEGDKKLEVQSVTNLRTNAKAENPDFADRPPPPPRGPRGRGGKAPPPPDRGRQAAGVERDKSDTSIVRGKVDRFTTAPKGETDGAVLDDGTTLHWPPHMADRFTDILKKGDRVRATGRTETGPEGDKKLEVQSVTNLRTNAKAENPDFADRPPPPPRGRGVARSRPADPEQRLKDLEDQVDQLRREIQHLRREK